jgi:hypothetical protein
MDEPPNPRQTGWSRLRIAAAILIGLAGSVVIWVATPYNNFIIDTGHISDSYLPAAALFLLLVLVLAINPLLRHFRARLALNRRQLALVLAILLMASVIPGQGLLRFLPYAVAGTNWRLNQRRPFWDAYQQIDAPESLFPDETGYGKDSPVSYGFLQKLGRDEPIPWHAWLSPLASWGGLAFFALTMMLGLAMIVLPQWRRNERLAFPLLSVEQSLIDTPEDGHLYARLFRSKGFWIAAGTVFALHLLRGLNAYFPEDVPAVPLSWNLTELFTEGALRHVRWTIKQNQFYFFLIGVAFFMPNRISFSIWFFQLVYTVYPTVCLAYRPPFRWGAIRNHRTGAMLALSVGILWLGRHHWAQVVCSMVRRTSDDNDRFNRAAGVTFAVGCAGVFGWLVWVGVQPLVALGLLAIGFMVSLLIARLVAETGMPFLRIDSGYPPVLLRLAPVRWFTAGSVFFSGVISMLFQFGSRVSAAAMGTHAIGLDEDASLRSRARTAWLLLAVMMVGVVVSGATHVALNYRYDVSHFGRSPINSWGLNSLNASELALREWNGGKFNTQPYNEFAHIGFGAALAGALQWACIALPRWPLHPIGLLIVDTNYSWCAWVSILVGWLLKTIIVHYGGARMYRKAVPVFMGMIVGEVLAAILWSIVPVMVIWAGKDFVRVLVAPD